MTINAEEAIRILESSFKPLECKAEIWDRGQKIRFRVLSLENEGIVKVDKLTRIQFSKPNNQSSLTPLIWTPLICH